MSSDKEKKLDQLLEHLSKRIPTPEQCEKWLTEDYTEEFNRHCQTAQDFSCIPSICGNDEFTDLYQHE